MSKVTRSPNPALVSPRQELVAQGVASGKTIVESMRAAGYAESTCKTRGSYVLNQIEGRVAEIQEEILKAQLVTSEKLLRRWSEAFEADVADIMTADGRHYKPITEWPKIWRQMLSGIDVKALYQRSTDGKASSWDMIGEIVKIKFISMKDLGELIGRHKLVDAFVKNTEEHHEHLHLHATITDKLQAARQRLIDAKARQITEGEK